MFTGIIEATAKVLEKKPLGLVLERPKDFTDIKIGSSIAVSGVCLSVIAFDNQTMSFDVIPTTFQKTKLGDVSVGDAVNLERAMSASGRFEGHVVTGHIEATGQVLSFQNGLLKVKVPQEVLPFIVQEGSVTLDGVALTVAALKGAELTVALILHTLEHSTLGSLKPNDKINLETDILAKYVLNHVRR